MTKPIEQWVTIQVIPSKHMRVVPKVVAIDPSLSPTEQNVLNFDRQLTAPMSPAWLLQELRSVAGKSLPAPHPTRVIAGHVVDGLLEPVDLSTHRVLEF